MSQKNYLQNRLFKIYDRALFIDLYFNRGLNCSLIFGIRNCDRVEYK
jgi:hypothetical protein